MAKRRVVIRVSEKQVQDWDELASRLGVSRGALISLAASIGAQVIRRQVAPEEVIDPGVAARVLEELYRRGVPLDLDLGEGKG